MYTYLIGWRNLDKWYYGSRVANNTQPEEDLWHTYFTSSSVVDSYRKQYGEPDVIRVHRSFSDRETTVNYEYRFVKRVNGVNSERWLNQAYPGHIPGGTPVQIASIKGKKHSEEMCRKRSEALSGEGNPWFGITGSAHPRFGKKLTPEQVEKLKAGQQAYYTVHGRPKRRPLTDEQKKRISIGRLANSKPLSQEHRDALARTQLGRKHSVESCAKRSSSLKGQPKSEEAKQAMRDSWARRKQKKNLIQL